MDKTNGSENAEAQQGGEGGGDLLNADVNAAARELHNHKMRISELEHILGGQAEKIEELQPNVQRVVDLEAALTEAGTALANSTSLLEAMSKERDDLAAKLAKLDAEPKAAKGARAAKARKCGPVDNPPALSDLQELIGMADVVELVFSDGKRELAIDPRVISGKAWIMTAVGLALRLPEFPVVGPATGPVSIAGYGLFLDGAQVAWASRGEPMEVPPGRRMDLRNDVVFAA